MNNCVLPFQSLLCWMLLGNNEKIMINNRIYISFNPCYVGCCSGIFVGCSLWRSIERVSILVMLDVAREFYIGFTFFESDFEFQSLLCWMLLGNSLLSGSSEKT